MRQRRWVFPSSKWLCLNWTTSNSHSSSHPPVHLRTPNRLSLLPRRRHYPPFVDFHSCEYRVVEWPALFSRADAMRSSTPARPSFRLCPLAGLGGSCPCWNELPGDCYTDLLSSAACAARVYRSSLEVSSIELAPSLCWLRRPCKLTVSLPSVSACLLQSSLSFSRHGRQLSI